MTLRVGPRRANASGGTPSVKALVIGMTALPPVATEVVGAPAASGIAGSGAREGKDAQDMRRATRTTAMGAPGCP